MGREFPTDTSQPSNVVVFNNVTPFYGTSDRAVVNSQLDSHLNDGSYFTFGDIDSISFYNSSDVLQWTVTSDDIVSGSTAFQRMMFLDYSNDLIYMSSYVTGYEQQLFSITISTGGFTLIGSQTTDGWFDNTSTLDDSRRPTPSTKSGDVITTMYQGTRYTVNVTTGVFDNGTPIEKSEYYVDRLNYAEIDTGGYAQVSFYGYGGNKIASHLYIPSISVTTAHSSYVQYFGENVYFGSTSGMSLVTTTYVKNDDWIKEMTRIAKNFVDKDANIAWGAE